MEWTDEMRDRIVSRGDRWLDAYWFGFEPTGDGDIDIILGAVALAGKMYHNTESWNDDDDDDPTPVEIIQAAANRAAARRAL